MAQRGIQPGESGVQLKLAINPGRVAQLQSLPSGAARVLEAAAAAGVVGHHDFIARTRLEDRCSPLSAHRIPEAIALLPTHFGADRRGGAQAEVQTRQRTRPVGNLVERRGFETTADRRVDIGAVADAVLERQHGQHAVKASASAVVAIAVGDVLVARLKLHVAPAQASQRRPIGREAPRNLGIRVDIGQHVAFLSAQGALDPQHAVAEIVVATAVLFHNVGGQAGHQAEWARRNFRIVRPAQIHAAIGALQIDHAARAGGRLLRCGRRGLVLHDLAFARVDHHAQGVGAVDPSLIGQARLGLAGVLAGVVVDRVLRNRTRIGGPVGGGHATRVLRVHRYVACHQRQLAVRANPGVDPRIQQVLVGGALPAPAVGQVAAGTDDIADALAFTLSLEAQTLLAIAADCEGALDAGRTFTSLGIDVEHTTGRVAIQRRVGAAQHLDALRRRKVYVADLPLPVRHRRGDSIHKNLHAAHAEGGPSTMAANRQLQVLRVVLPVLQQQARYAGKGFRQVHLPLAIARALTVHHGDRRRGLIQCRWRQRAAHGHVRQRGDVSLLCNGHLCHGHEATQCHGLQRVRRARGNGWHGIPCLVDGFFGWSICLHIPCHGAGRRERDTCSALAACGAAVWNTHCSRSVSLPHH